MLKQIALVVFLVALASVAKAHPHTDVKQQALLSIGLTKLDVNIHIMPSYTEGKDIWFHIDTNKDKHISQKEAQMFINEVFNQVNLVVNDQAVRLENHQLTSPAYDDVSAGVGAIKISAKANYRLDKSRIRQQELVFQVKYEKLDHDWHIQPFYYPKFNQSMANKRIRRWDRGHALQLTFSP